MNYYLLQLKAYVYGGPFNDGGLSIDDMKLVKADTLEEAQEKFVAEYDHFGKDLMDVTFINLTLE